MKIKSSTVKLKSVIKKRASKTKIKTHEERLIDQVFSEEEPQDNVERTINIDPPEDMTADTYYFADYGLEKEETTKVWEETATAFAKEFGPYVIKVMAILDSVKYIEEHMKETVQAPTSLLETRGLQTISSILDAKLMTMIISELEFSSKQDAEIFANLVLKKAGQTRGISPLEALSMAVPVDKENDPYAVNRGEGSLVHKLRER